MEVLKINNLIKIYSLYKGAKETRVLDGINLNDNKGGFVGIMGPSGSGKQLF